MQAAYVLEEHSRDLYLFCLNCLKQFNN